MRLLLLLVALLAYTSAFASERQFVCEFTQEVSVSGATTANPKPRVKAISDKYTFIYDGANSSYINLKFGTKVPLYATLDSQKATFTEKNVADNNFAVTIFLAKPVNHRVRAIMSQHSLVDGVDYYDPSQRYGTCI